MRRFIKSLLGRVICNVAIVALVLPSFSLILAGRVDAQLQTSPAWAIVDFVCKDKAIGLAAAEAMQSALGKVSGIDLIPKETVDRTIVQLALQPPITEKTSLMRLGAEVGAATIVTGNVVAWQVSSSGGGKKATVVMRVVVTDVASGLPINGAALQASSSVRTGDSEDMTVLNEALATAAAKATIEIRSKTLPTATVLNTIRDTALINHGTRTGFKAGMELVVTRGRDQVAVAQVTDVEPDSSTIRITRFIRGIQPGDRVRAVYDVPMPKNLINDNDDRVKTVGVKRPKGDSGFGTLVGVALVLGVLMGSGNSKGFNAARSVSAQATLYPDFSGSPAVMIKWKRDAFLRGNQAVVQWQVYRNDVLGSPVMAVPGNFGQAVDDNIARDVGWYSFAHWGGQTCENADLDGPNTDTEGVAGVVPGRPYTYRLELCYRVAGIDLPGNGSTGGGFQTTGTTTGTTTGGTTGGTQGGGGGGTGQWCYFVSQQQNARGIATPLPRASLISPAPNAVISTDVPFTFMSVVNPTFPIQVEYALQVSSSPNFLKGNSLVLSRFTRGDTGTLSTGNISSLLSRLASKFGSSQKEFWWRIGAKNVADVPGPVTDPSGETYVFGDSRRFTLPAAPPPPPE